MATFDFGLNATQTGPGFSVSHERAAVPGQDNYFAGATPAPAFRFATGYPGYYAGITAPGNIVLTITAKNGTSAALPYLDEPLIFTSGPNKGAPQPGFEAGLGVLKTGGDPASDDNITTGETAILTFDGDSTLPGLQPVKLSNLVFKDNGHDTFNGTVTVKVDNGTPTQITSGGPFTASGTKFEFSVGSTADTSTGSPAFYIKTAQAAPTFDPYKVANNSDPNATKFYVSGGSDGETFTYGSVGKPTGSYDTPKYARGDDADINGTNWVVTKTGDVYSYLANGSSAFPTWTALDQQGKSIKDPEGIAIRHDGDNIGTPGDTDIWIVGGSDGEVFFYDNVPASQTGTLNASPTKSFALSPDNKKATGIVNDGTSLWVLDGKGGSDFDKDKSNGKQPFGGSVFKYDAVTGAPQGRWGLDPNNANATGLTLDPANPTAGNIWVVDNKGGSDFDNDKSNGKQPFGGEVFLYNGATGFPTTPGTVRTANSVFPLLPDNKDAQGISDPPPSVQDVFALDQVNASTRVALFAPPPVAAI